MSDLSQQNTESAVMTESIDISSNWGAGSNARGRITDPALQNIRTLQQIHMEKVLTVQHQLTEGTYDIDKRLNVVLDHLLEDLVA